jgi:sugar phosphate isomerase/epimerase
MVQKIPVALQVYSVREAAAQDLRGTLEQIAEMGYAGVEFAGYYDTPAQALREMLDELGLKVAGTHTGWRTVQPEALAETIEFNRILGNKNLIVPGLPPERRGTREAWLQTAAFFDDLAEQLGPHGMRAGYHNHAVEFQPLDGENPWDTFARHTRPGVILQLDLGNAAHGGADPVAYLRKYADRAVTVHLKDYSPTNDKALLGEGQIDFGEVFRICESSGRTEWYIVEQESYAYPPLECVRRCRDALKQLGR